MSVSELPRADWNQRQVVLTDGRLMAMMAVIAVAALLLIGSAYFTF